VTCFNPALPQNYEDSNRGSKQESAEFKVPRIPTRFMDPDNQITGQKAASDKYSKTKSPKISSYNSVTAVSVSQIIKLTRPSGNLIIHEHTVQKVNLVGLINEILEQTSHKFIATIDDYTSEPVEVRYSTGEGVEREGTKFVDAEWKSLATGADSAAQKVGFAENMDGESRKSINDIKPDDYIRIIGRVELNSDRRPVVMAYVIKVIEDPNLITMHILEVIRDSMYYEKISKERREKEEARSKLPRYTRELGDREIKLFEFVKDNAGAYGVCFKEMRSKFKTWSVGELKEVITNIERAGLMWQGDSEEIWVPNVDDI